MSIIIYQKFTLRCSVKLFLIYLHFQTQGWTPSSITLVPINVPNFSKFTCITIYQKIHSPTWNCVSRFTFSNTWQFPLVGNTPLLSIDKLHTWKSLRYPRHFPEPLFGKPLLIDWPKKKRNFSCSWCLFLLRGRISRYRWRGWSNHRKGITRNPLSAVIFHERRDWCTAIEAHRENQRPWEIQQPDTEGKKVVKRFQRPASGDSFLINFLRPARVLHPHPPLNPRSRTSGLPWFFFSSFFLLLFFFLFFLSFFTV